jgi:hypothetical protein
MELQRLKIEDLSPEQIVLYWNGSTETVCQVGEIRPDGLIHLLEAPGMMYQKFLPHRKVTPPGIYVCPKKRRNKHENRIGLGSALGITNASSW